MSHLPGNPYADSHEEMYHQVGQGMVADLGQTEATLIWSAIENHAQATLALAYEQRTANLIAYVEKIDDQTLIVGRCADIAHRLGLKTIREMRAGK